MVITLALNEIKENGHILSKAVPENGVVKERRSQLK